MKRQGGQFPKVRVFAPNYYLRENPDKNGSHWEGEEVEAEVLTLHLSTGQMRVRFWNDDRKEFKAQDFPIDEFFKHYEIVEKREKA